MYVKKGLSKSRKAALLRELLYILYYTNYIFCEKYFNVSWNCTVLKLLYLFLYLFYLILFSWREMHPKSFKYSPIYSVPKIAHHSNLSSSFDSTIAELVFCYQNCSDLLWEKNVLVIEKNFWNSRLKAENLQIFWIFRTILEQFIQTMKSWNNFWIRMLF